MNKYTRTGTQTYRYREIQVQTGIQRDRYTLSHVHTRTGTQTGAYTDRYTRRQVYRQVHT